MKFDRNTIAKICLAVASCLPFSLVQTQSAPAQESAPQTERGAGPAQRGGRGMMASDPRVQNRTYLFTDTNENLPYAVFISSKVTKDKKAPLVIALRGHDGTPLTFLRGAALDQAEEGGYILVGPMGYNSISSYGMPMRGFGEPGVRGTAPASAPNTASATAPQTQPSATQPKTEATRGTYAGRGGMQIPIFGGTAVSDPEKASELSEKDVMNVLAMVRKEFNIDDRRMYLVGHSQGGGGALHIAEKYSSIWAGAALLAPGVFGFQPDANSKIKDVPMLIMVGDADMLLTGVRRLDEQLKSANIAHEYKEVPGLDHSTIIMGSMPDVFKFFAKHSKPESK